MLVGGMPMAKRIFLFVVTNIAIVFTLSIILNLLGAGRYISPDGRIDYTQLAVFCFVWGMGGSFLSLQLSRWTAKRAMGVQLVNGQTGTQDLDWLYNTVGQLTRQANLPMPEVGVYDSPEVNAFATGPSKRRSLVACSTGLLRNMTRDEVQGVLAHEISHVANGDMVTMTLLQGVINAFVMFLSRIVAHVIRQTMDSRAADTVAFLVMIVLQIVLGLLGSLIVAWFSRHREFRADAGGAALAGRGAMVGALKRLLATQERVDVSNTALASFKIAGGRSWLQLFSTHPPLELRIAALESAS
jgi:heat shock protein HtpX